MVYDSAQAVYVVIVAGGRGTRMGMALPKQFLPLAGKPVLFHTINAFVKTLPAAHIVLVLPEDEISKLQMVLQHFSERVDLTVTAGGPTRFDSVKNGLKNIPEDALVLVHDGVRPFVSDSLIHRCLHAAQNFGAAIPVIEPADSMRFMEDDELHKAVDRSKFRMVQTPQAFSASVLLPAFAQPFRPDFTDEASVVESMHHRITLVQGEKTNIKITTPEDLHWAECLMAKHGS